MAPKMTHFQLRLAVIKDLLEETPNIEIDSKSESDSRPTPAPQNRPGPSGDGRNDEDDKHRAIGKKVSIEEANVDDGWTTNITLPPNRRLRINRTVGKQNVGDLSELRLVMLFLDDGVLRHIVTETMKLTKPGQI